MADIDRENQASSPINITGGDELYKADVIEEDGFYKLLVKSTTVSSPLRELVFLNAENGSGTEMNVNGSVTPVEFYINAPAAGQDDIVVRELRFNAYDNGVKVDNFLAQNAPLTNGIVVDVNIGGVMSAFLPIKSTAEFNANFAFGNGGKFDIIVGAGNDFMTATFSPLQAFKLTAGSSDYVRVTINDNLSNVASLSFIAFGYKEV